MKVLNKTYGFTLIEMMSVLTLASALLLTGVSFYQDQMKRHLAKLELLARAHEFIQDAHFARRLAMQTKNYVSLLPQCGNHWDSGWMVVQNPQFFHNDVAAPSSSDHIHFKRSPFMRITSSKYFSLSKHKGNQFEDMSLINHQNDCPSNHIEASLAFRDKGSSSSKKQKHLTFHPSGLAQMKRGGFIANRLVLASKAHPDLEIHIVMGAGGRLRTCLKSGQQSCYE